MAGHIFVSYSQTDRDTALEIVAVLEARGIDCWVAPRDITPSAEWAAEIIDAISTSRLMLLVFSRSSNQSPQVRREVERAVHKRVPIIAFRVDDVMPEKSLEYFLSSQHWLDAFPAPHEPHYDRLFRTLERVLNMPQSAGEPASAAHAPASYAPLPFAEAALLHLERQLARQVGPIARILVRRAATRCSSIEQLRGQLAAEIESERGRREFIVGASS
jgi:hypothetical protein